ncbi:MAG TPA: LysM domain-containing protein [Tepidiformaceae bacterium]|nr:LysM domain-containing protein [Tepidiformaceae bacterium]
MPVATIALFGLAVLVIALAVIVTQLADGGDGNDLTQAEIFQTTQAQRTQAPAGTTTATGSTTPGTRAPTQAGASPTRGTPAAATATTRPNGGGRTYVVESGDLCITIAEENDITLEELLEANDMTEDDCSSLQVGDELVIPG